MASSSLRYRVLLRFRRHAVLPHHGEQLLALLGDLGQGDYVLLLVGPLLCSAPSARGTYHLFGGRLEVKTGRGRRAQDVDIVLLYGPLLEKAFR